MLRITAYELLDTSRPGATCSKVARVLMGTTIWILEKKWEERPVVLTTEDIVSICHVGFDISQVLAMLALACSGSKYMRVKEQHRIDHYQREYSMSWKNHATRLYISCHIFRSTS